MNIYLYILLLVMVLAAGMSVALVKQRNERAIKLLLAFSGAFLLGMTVLHLLPEVYDGLGHQAGIFILVGFFAQIILEFFSKGIEHGHVHAEKGKAKFPLAIYISLCVHAFLEGLPVQLLEDHAHAHAHDHGFGHDTEFVIGVMMHKVPVAIVLVSLFLHNGMTVLKSFWWLLVFTLMMPLGSLAHLWIMTEWGINHANYDALLMAVVIGVLLHVSTTILFESSENHRFTGIKFLVILLGVSLAFFSLH